MPDYRNPLTESQTADTSIGSIVGQLDKLGAARRQQQQFQQEQALKQFLPVQQKQLEEQQQNENLGKVQDLMENQKPGPYGGKTSYGLTGSGGVTAMAAQPNTVMMNMNETGKEGRILSDRASKAFKPIEDQANAAKQTLDQLNVGNPTADKAAVMNEARLVTGSTRGVVALYQALGGKPTANTQMADMENYINNQANSTLQPAQRDAMRESVYSRLKQTRQAHQQIMNTLQKTAPSYAPMMANSGQLNDTINAYGSGPKQTLDELDQSEQQYRQQKSNPQSAAPGGYTPAPSNMEKIKQGLSSFFGGGQSQPQQPAQAPMSFEEFKARKKAGNL